MECRNHDCKRNIGWFEFDKMKQVRRPLQTRYNYCVKCRRGKIYLIKCYFCQDIMQFTTYPHYICKICSKKRRANRTRKCYLRNRVLIGKGKYISKYKKLEKILKHGTYSNKELCEMLAVTKNTLKVLRYKVNKLTPIKYGYTIKV